MSEIDTKAVAIPREKHEIGEAITEKLILSYMDNFGIGAKLNDNEKTQFINVAVAYKLNPFKREIYCNAHNTKDGRKLSIITGYEVYLKRAERIGDLDGWEVTTFGSMKDGTFGAQIVIHRKSWSHPFKHEVLLTEYDQNHALWLTKKVTMIKKVVTAQGFRLAFPDELGGMPYTADELPDNMTGAIDTTAEPRKPQESTKPAGPQRASATEPTAAELKDLADKKKAEFHADEKTATGFVSNVSEPNKGGYVTVSLDGVNRPDDKPRKFATKEKALIDAILDRRDGGEKVTLTYTENENPKFADSIVTVVDTENRQGDVRPGD